MKKRAGKIKEVTDTAKSKGFSEDDLSRIRFLFVALLVLSVGFYMLKDFSDISVGKAYSVVFEGQEFAESVEINLLADVPEIIELTVDNAVKNILFGLTGSAGGVTVSVGDSVVFASDPIETQILDTFYATSEINNFCVAFPCRVPITITSETDGTLTLSSLEVEIESIEEVSLEEPAGEVEVAAVEGEATNILEFPAPNNFHCFLEENQNNPECSQYYKEECTSAQCWKVLACPRFYNPVCGVDALFYPSACWAEQLGTSVASYGYCDSLKKFISDLWSKEGFDVPSPNIEFAYSDTGHVSSKNGAFLRSVLWKDSSEFFILDYNIDTEDGTQQSTFFSKHITTNPVYGTNLKSLLVFVMFDNAYPENVLLEWTNVYEPLINDYIKKKQILSNPIQYDIVPVVIDPPLGVERPSQSHLFFTQEEMQKVYDAAINKIGGSDYDIFIMSPVFLNGGGGYFSWWNDMEFIEAPLHPSEPYSDTDKQKGFDALAAFQVMFSTISHEILHALGLPGDHMPMGYGTLYLDAIGQNVDPITGKERTAPSWCDFFGTSQDYYVVEIPNNLEINVGQEPSWLSKSESLTGPCLSGLYNNEWLKDYDKDGKYEIIYKNNLIGKELQRALGWVDIDGDGITELIDPNAYGGWKKIEEEADGEQTCETTFDCPIYHKCEQNVCVNFCGGKTLDAGSTAESGKEASQSAIQKLNNLGYDVVGNADLSGFEIQKSGNKLIFSSETQFDVFDQQFDSFVFVNKNGNTANIQKRQSSVQKAKPKATYIVELIDRPLLEEKSELEKKLEMQKVPPKTIKEKIQKQLKSHEQRLKDAKAKAIEEMLKVNADIKSKIVNEYKNVFNGFSVEITEQEALELKEISSVKNVYRNEEVKALLEESVNQINADELWKLKDGNNDLITGKGVTIGIIDTGVDYTHDDLGGCLGKNCKVIDGYDFVNNDNDPMDDNGHGTHVAATAAGNGILKGVAPDAKIVAYKVLDSGGSGSWNNIIQSIERSVDPNQDGDFSDHLDIISLSLGGSGNPDDPQSTAIDNAVKEGVIAVIAAGNSGPYEQSIGSPGTARKAITVGAVEKCDSIAGFSSRGPVVWEDGILLKPDLAAPGVEICAAQFDDWLNERACRDDKHIAISGTSMAAPHVSGAAALLLQSHPDWSPEIVKSALMSTSLDLGLSPIEQGAGRINVLEANSAEISIEPQSIAFEMSTGKLEHIKTITIKNLISEELTLQLQILELKDQNGNEQDFASLNVSELRIAKGSSEDVGLIIEMEETVEGFFTGKILVKSSNSDYTIPFIFEKLSKLTVKTASKDKKLQPSVFIIHDKGLSIFEHNAFSLFSETGKNEFTFKVPSGIYTAYAIDVFETELDYILMDEIEVPPSSEVELVLKLDDATAFKIKAESLKDVPLIYNWMKGFKTYDDKDVRGVASHDIASENQTVYISKKPENALDTDILFSLNGVPLTDNTGEIDFSDFEFDTVYTVADEQYAVGWVLHNVDDKTETNLEYSKEDFAVYNYSFNFPAQQPEYFANVLFWVPPIHKNSGGAGALASHVRLGVPLERLYYLKGVNPVPENYWTDWSFANYIHLNYLKSDNDLGQFAMDVSQAEHYQSEDAFNAIKPVPGEKKDIFFGTAPFTPASLIIKDDIITLNGHLIRGHNNNSYLQRINKTGAFSSTGEEIEIEFPEPTYKIYLNGILKEKGELVSIRWPEFPDYNEFGIFDYSVLNYEILEDGTYIVELTIPTYYPIWNNTIITASFTAPSDEMQPPELQHIEANPYFIAGEEYDILVDLYDESGIEKVEIMADKDLNPSAVGIELVPEITDVEKQIYSASLIPSEDFGKIHLRIKATDTKGNSITYQIRPIALPAQSISLSLEADKDVASNGDRVTLEGECETNDGPCDTFLMHYYANNEFLKTDATSEWDGSFEFEWKVPFDYNADEINFTVKYDGTGIYLPHEESISIPLQTFDEDIGIFDLKTTDPVIGEPINVSAAVKNLGSSDAHNTIIEFKVNKKVLDIKMIPFIQAKKGELIEFEWMPIREDSYDIELEAIPEHDDDLSNNFLEKELEISYIAPDITGFIEEPEKIIIDLESDISFSIFNNGEEKAKDLEAAFYAFYKPKRAFLFFPTEAEVIEEVIETPGAPVEEPIEEPAKAQDKEEEEETPSEEPIGREPSPPGGGGGGSTKPKEKPIDIGSVDYNGTKYDFLASAEGFDLELNVSTETFNETLNFSYNDRIRKLHDDIYIFADFFSESSVLLTVGNASLIKKDLDDLDSGAFRTETIKWTPTLKGEHFLLVFVNTSKDSNFETNYFANDVKVLREGVNIRAEFMIDYEKTFVAGNETNITARITNLGNEEARNMHIALFEQKIEEVEEDIIPKIKKKEIGSKKLDSLGEGKNEELRFSWTPSKPGENFLLLIAEAKGDINPEDNDDRAFIDVTSESADVTAGFEVGAGFEGGIKLYSDSIFANEEQQLIAVIGNRGKSDANDVSLSLYETIDKETRLVEKKDIGTLKSKRELNAEFKWTPSENGRVELVLEGFASNDDNQENNNDSIIVDVFVKDVDVKVTLESYPGFILAGKNNPIGILLQNFGSKNAPGFTLDLKVNDVKADSISLERLGSGYTGNAKFIYLNWVPENEGNFEIKAEINLTDADLSNNNDTDTVKVFKTKEIKLGFVDKDGNNAERALLIGSQETLVIEPVVLTIPDTKLKMWIGDEEEDNIAASMYSNVIIGNTSITSAHINELTAKDGLVLYEIFANNDSWDYESFSSFLVRSIDTLNIRYTELEAFYCNDYNFSGNTCKEWKDVPLETLVSRGDLLASIDTAKAAAFAIGDKDYDNDNAPDWDDSDSDNDGIEDDQDTFTCFNGRLKSREAFNITINESEDIDKEFKGRNKIGIKDKNKKIVEFDIDFNEDSLDCREVVVEKQPEVTTRGYTLIKGVNLTNDTKTAYVDKIAAFNRVCIKDEDVDSIDELSQNCDGSNEFMVMCDGIKHGNYTCTSVGSQYKVEGLTHSAVAEPTSCQESWSCTEWSKCANGKQTRTCTETNACGTSFNKPSEQRSCDEDEEEEDKGLSGSLSRNTFDLGEIKSWSDGKSRTLKLGEHDVVIFTFDKKLRNIELEQIKGTRISIKPSWSGKSIDLTAGETKSFDIDNDKKDDIKFTFETISRDKATVVIERTIEDARVSQPTRVQPQPADEEDDLRKELEKAKTPSFAAEAKDEGSIATAIVLVSFFAILSVLIGLIIYKRDEIMEFISEKAKGKEAKPLSEYDKVKSYILNELNRGFTMEKITEKLEEVGWQKELIELVMREINKKR